MHGAVSTRETGAWRIRFNLPPYEGLNAKAAPVGVKSPNDKDAE